MTSPRAERDALLFAVDKDVDALQRPIARAVVDSIRRHVADLPEGATMTPQIRAQVLADTDAALAKVYGRYLGDARAPLYQLILRRSRQAAMLPVTAAVTDMRRRLRGEPDVLNLLEGESRS